MNYCIANFACARKYYIGMHNTIFGLASKINVYTSKYHNSTSCYLVWRNTHIIKVHEDTTHFRKRNFRASKTEWSTLLSIQISISVNTCALTHMETRSFYF